jgi:hypothetical protein
MCAPRQAPNRYGDLRPQGWAPTRNGRGVYGLAVEPLDRELVHLEHLGRILTVDGCFSLSVAADLGGDAPVRSPSLLRPTIRARLIQSVGRAGRPGLRTLLRSSAASKWRAGAERFRYGDLPDQ